MIVFLAVNRPILGHQILKWRCQGLLMATAARWSSIPWPGNLNQWILPIQELAEFQQILMPFFNGAFQMGLPPVIWKIGLSWIHEKKTVQLLGLQFFKAHLPGLDTRLPGAQRRCWPTGSHEVDTGKAKINEAQIFSCDLHHFSIFYMEIKGGTCEEDFLWIFMDDYMMVIINDCNYHYYHYGFPQMMDYPYNQMYIMDDYMGISINGGSPIAGWLLSWEYPSMDDMGAEDAKLETSWRFVGPTYPQLLCL